MVEEFKVYGYSETTTYLVGGVKLLLSLFTRWNCDASFISSSMGILCLIMFWVMVNHIKVEMNKPMKAALLTSFSL